MDWRFWQRAPKAPPCKCYGEFIAMRTHEFAIISTHLLGVDLSWNARPVPTTESTIRCMLCERVFTRSGYMPGTLWHREYPPDATGWPTENGKRIEMRSYPCPNP
jgi:hypothetical protein